MELKQIASFAVDHTKLKPGIYVSRVDGDAVTYDLRMREPNKGDYLEMASMHTFEHLFATYARSGPCADSIIYIGPMGCRTGFYMVTRDNLSKQQVIQLIQEMCAFVADFHGPIPGATEKECGNYREQDMEAARKDAIRFGKDIANWTPGKMEYQK